MKMLITINNIDVTQNSSNKQIEHENIMNAFHYMSL